jgi:hypothetical protein
MGNSDESHVGLFFYVEDEIVMLSTPMSEGENDGDFINDPRGHSDCWEALAVDPKHSAVRKNGDKSYDFFPRGRCLYRAKDDRYMLYVDRCLVKKSDVIDERDCCAYLLGRPALSSTSSTSVPRATRTMYRTMWAFEE